MLPIYTRTVPPATEPFSSAQLLDFLKADAADQVLVSQLGAVAREFVEEQTGRALVTQTWTLKQDAWEPYILLDITPLVSVTSVKYYPADGGAQETLSTSVYRTILAGSNSPGWIERIEGQTWPDIAQRSDAIEITFVAGAADNAVKSQLVHAIFLLTKHLYDNGRDPVNIGNIVSEVPYTLKDFINSQRVGGWFA